MNSLTGAIAAANVQGATFATAGLTLSTATLNFELSGITADVLNVTKAASLAGTNTINLTPLAALTNGNYNLITAASGLNTVGTFKFANGLTTSVGTFGANNYLLTLSSTATAASVSCARSSGRYSGRRAMTPMLELSPLSPLRA